MEAETIVVGGGPAGSSCAWELRRNGRECLILERQDLPKFKLCAGWISPQVIRDLEMDIKAYPHGIMELAEIRVYLGRSGLGFRFPTSQFSIRRCQFDNWLLGRSGARVVKHAARVITSDRESYAIDGEFRCRYLVGAGGTNCPVKRAFFSPDRGQRIITQEVEFETAPNGRICTLFYPFGGWAGYGWYVPKADGVNIGFGGAAPQFKKNIKEYWDGFVETLLARKLIDAPPPPPSSHPYYVGDREKIARRGNAFIVGDAAGLATMDMGEGIGPAVASGLLAARQILGRDEYDLGKIPALTLDGPAGRLMGRLVMGST